VVHTNFDNPKDIIKYLDDISKKEKKKGKEERQADILRY